MEIIGERGAVWRKAGRGRDWDGACSQWLDAAQQGGESGGRLGSPDGGQAPPGPARGLEASASVSSPLGSSFSSGSSVHGAPAPPPLGLW